MNGDEDLGEDIIMKGEPYHYHQKKFATGMNGDEDLGEDIIMKGEPYTTTKKWFNSVKILQLVKVMVVIVLSHQGPRKFPFSKLQLWVPEPLSTPKATTERIIE